MKYSLWLFIALAFVIAACENDKQTRETTCVQHGNYDYLENYNSEFLCTDDLCLEYLAVWKELICEKNNLSQDFFDAHIELCQSELHNWADGVSFRVCYTFKLGWAMAYNCDQFIIKINADNALYPSVDLPRDTYLTKVKIKIAVDNRAFSSDIKKIAPADNLKFSTMDQALDDLIEFSGVNQLCLNQIMINRDNGNLILKATAQYKDEVNSCIEGTIDLISGAKSVTDIPCWIN